MKASRKKFETITTEYDDDKHESLITTSYSDMIRKFQIFRSSHPEVFCEKGVLRNFAKFTGKQLCQSLFFNNIAGLRHATLLKKGLWHRYFPGNFAKFL